MKRPITLRWYQQAALDAIISQKAANPLVQLECGLGKSYLCAGIVRSLPVTERILMVLPNSRLVVQNAQALAEMGIKDVGIYCAGLGKKDGTARVVVGTLHSLYRSQTPLKALTTIIVDEAHLMALDNPKSRWSRLAKSVGSHVTWIGMTATPWRMVSNKPVDLLDCEGTPFRSMAYRTDSIATYRRLLNEGHLAPLRTVNVGLHLDANLRTVEGDYQVAELEAEALACVRDVTVDALKHLADRKRIMWFCASIAHAKRQHDELVARGERVSIVTGGEDADENDRQLDAFRNSGNRHAVSVAMLTTGFNVPDVDALVLVRKTKSLVLHRQILGRGVRPAPPVKSDCIVLDYARNIARLGAINTPLDQIRDSTKDLWECGNAPITLPWYGPMEDAPPLDDEDDEDAGVGCSALNPRSTIKCEACGKVRTFEWRGAAAKMGDDDGPGDAFDDEEYDENVAVQLDGNDLSAQVTHAVETFSMEYSTEQGEILMHIAAGPLNQVFRLQLAPSGGDDALRTARSRQMWKAASGQQPRATTLQCWLMQRDTVEQPISVTLAAGTVRRVVFPAGVWTYAK